MNDKLRRKLKKAGLTKALAGEMLNSAEYILCTGPKDGEFGVCYNVAKCLYKPSNIKSLAVYRVIERLQTDKVLDTLPDQCGPTWTKLRYRLLIRLIKALHEYLK